MCFIHKSLLPILKVWSYTRWVLLILRYFDFYYNGSYIVQCSIILYGSFLWNKTLIIELLAGIIFSSLITREGIQHILQVSTWLSYQSHIISIHSIIGLSHSNWWATHQNHSSLSFIYKSKAKGHPCLTPLSRWICSVHPLLVQTTDCTWLYMLSTMVHIISKLDNFFHTITCNT